MFMLATLTTLRILTYLLTPLVVIFCVATLFAGGWFVAAVWAGWWATIHEMSDGFTQVYKARKEGRVKGGPGRTAEWLMQVTETVNINPSQHIIHAHGTQDLGMYNSDLGYDVPVVVAHRAAIVCPKCSAAWPPRLRKAECHHCGTPLKPHHLQRLA
jgi:hypothetical protein